MKNHKKKNDYLEYSELLYKVLEEKRVIGYLTLTGIFFGFLIAFSTPKEYQSAAIILSESEDSGNLFGMQGGLAGLAGINLPQMQQSQSAITPEMFPDIVGSRDFLLDLMKEKFYFQTKGEEMTLEEYYATERPANLVQKSIGFVLSLPSRLIGLFQKSPIEVVEQVNSEEVNFESRNYVNVTSQENYVIGQLRKRINIDLKKKIITLKVFMPEALISAQVNVLVIEKLIKFVVKYRTAKQNFNVDFVEERVQEAEQKFMEAQDKLATFRDTNQGIVSQRARSKEELLQSEFNIAFNIYNTLKQELEQSNMKLKRETPIFSVLERASVPLSNGKPNKPLIIVASIFIGLMIGIIFSVFKIITKSLKTSENQ